MSLKEYFENQSGLGVIATADSNGKVDTAVYSKPHVIDEETIAFIMTDRLSHKNIESNPYASYLFKESGEGYTGKRLWDVRGEPLLASMRLHGHQSCITPILV